MLHFLETTGWILFSGLCGIFVSLFMKAGDYNKETDDITLRQALGRMISHEWRSYMVSVTVLVFISFTHDEWLKWLSTSKYTADTIFAEFGIMVKLAAFALCFIMQHGIYKYWLGKLSK